MLTAKRAVPIHFIHLFWVFTANIEPPSPYEPWPGAPCSWYGRTRSNVRSSTSPGGLGLWQPWGQSDSLTFDQMTNSHSNVTFSMFACPSMFAWTPLSSFSSSLDDKNETSVEYFETIHYTIETGVALVTLEYLLVENFLPFLCHHGSVV